MKAEELRQIVNKIKEYDLTKTFSKREDFDEWVKELNQIQINNFINLSINPSELNLPLGIITHPNLLNCEDYEKRLRALNEVKNCEGCWHLFGRFCSVHFLKSKTFYEDLKLIAKAGTARFPLWVIGEEVFANSPYRDEDLKLIVEAKSSLVAESLASVAESKESIHSKYHRSDMKIISQCDEDALQMIGAFPERGVNKLAIDEVSLKDPYHKENMEILAKNPEASRYLYLLMTNPVAIKRRTYRYEIEALASATTELKAMAIYNFIENPKFEYDWEFSNIFDYGMFSLNAYELGKNKKIKGIEHRNFLGCVELLNKVDDKFVLFISSILADQNSILSGDQEHDIRIILNVTDEDMFMDLYKVMTNPSSLESINHTKDVQLISEATNPRIRKMLFLKATNKESLLLRTHRFDMEYITKLNPEEIREDVLRKMEYYLCNKNGMTHPKHMEILERLYNGQPIDDINEMDDYFEQITAHSEEYVKEEPKKGFFQRLLRKR